MSELYEWTVEFLISPNRGERRVEVMAATSELALLKAVWELGLVADEMIDTAHVSLHRAVQGPAS
jgi:hypothetical protein